MNYQLLLDKMLREQIQARGIENKRVIEAMRKVPRHLFVPQELVSLAYADRPLPIGNDQTISQPYMVALMTALLELEPEENVLEIGTGSGYQTAILAELSQKVYTVERISELSERAREILESLGYRNVYFKVGDGSLGWKEFSPYHKIIVTAAAPEVPSPLFEQLEDGGRMVIPLGRKLSQELKLIIKKGRKMEVRDAGGCVFVPLIGEFGWAKEEKDDGRRTK